MPTAARSAPRVITRAPGYPALRPSLVTTSWYEFDVNYYGIWLLEQVGLAKKIQIAKFDPADPKPAGA